MSAPTALHDGRRLSFSGALLREHAATLAASLQSINARDVDTVELNDVDVIDSAGLALLSSWLNRNFADGKRPMLIGQPDGLADLLAAYRMTEQLEFVRSP